MERLQLRCRGGTNSGACAWFVMSMAAAGSLINYLHVYYCTVEPAGWHAELAFQVSVVMFCKRSALPHAMHEKTQPDVRSRTKCSCCNDAVGLHVRRGAAVPRTIDDSRGLLLSDINSNVERLLSAAAACRRWADCNRQPSCVLKRAVGIESVKKECNATAKIVVAH